MRRVVRLASERPFWLAAFRSSACESHLNGNEDAALAAFLGHLAVVQRSFGLTDRQVESILQRAIATRTPATSDGALSSDDDAFGDEDFEPTDPALTELPFEAAEVATERPPDFFASAATTGEEGREGSALSSDPFGADVPDLAAVLEEEPAAQSDPSSPAASATETAPPAAQETTGVIVPPPPASEPLSPEGFDLSSDIDGMLDDMLAPEDDPGANAGAAIAPPPPLTSPTPAPVPTQLFADAPSAESSISSSFGTGESPAPAFPQTDDFDDLLPAELTLPDAPPEPAEPSDQSVEALRSVPRFRNRTEIDVHLAGREDLQTLWTKDISKGGLFVTTSSPPSSGTHVTVDLKTPDGSLQLKAEVVHVLDAAAATAAGIDPGVGLQFIDLDAERRDALERYVDGIAGQLEDGSQEGAAEVEHADRVLLAKNFLRNVDGGDLYAAISAVPAADPPSVRQAINELQTAFGVDLEGLNESDRGRIERAGRVLERIQKVLLEPARRLDYDFRQDVVRAPERIEEARAAGEDLTLLRSVWERVWPDRVKEAQEFVAKAVEAIKGEGNFIEAVDQGAQAIALDPFNNELRVAHQSWTVVVSLPEAFAEESVDVDHWIAVAQSNQIDLKVLRGVWMHAQPENVQRAAEFAQKAMAAEGVQAFDQAVEQGETALRFDPFNQQLRTAIEKWRQKASDATSSESAG